MTAQWIAAQRQAIDRRLEALLARESMLSKLAVAARDSLLAPGKRVRPLLALATACHHGAIEERALDAACALEMIHTASLIMDDLPCMDNAELRRGRPALHRSHGEETALLTTIVLVNLAYKTIARAVDLSPFTRVELTTLLAETTGAGGLAGGQLQDLHGDPHRLQDLSPTHHGKTGVLFVAAVETGALVAGATSIQRKRLVQFATHLGLAFQALDDLKDKTATSAETGKDSNADQYKATVVSLLGVSGAKDRTRACVNAALTELSSDQRSSPLHQFTDAFFGSDVTLLANQPVSGHA